MDSRFLIVLPFLATALAVAAWKGWRGLLVTGLVVAAPFALLLVAVFGGHALGHAPATPAARFGEGQLVVLGEALTVLALGLGVLPGGLAGLLIRRLALRRRRPVLEVEPPIQK